MADHDTTERDDAEKANADSEAVSKLQNFLMQFDASAAPSQPNRAQALQARRFAFIPGAQYEGDGWDEVVGGMVKVQVNKTKKGLKKIQNDYRSNRVEVDFRAVGDDADEETADTLDGLYRADVYRSRAGMAHDGAFDEGTSGGLGAWRLCNDLEDEYDEDNDHQVINFLPIVDADQSVYFDPNSKNYDKSDAKWGCVITAVARQAFKDEYGDDRATDWPQGTVKPIYDWFTPDVTRICEWYQIEELKQRRWTLTNAVTGDEVKVWDKDVSKDWLNEQLAGGWTQTGRDVPRKRVRKYKMTGAEFLDGSEGKLIAGPNIPIILFYGERRFIDNVERFDGHVADAMDPQRIYNSQVSRLVETASTSPQKRPYFYPEQVAGHEESLGKRNSSRLAYNLINPMYAEDGTLLPLNGPIAYDEPAEMSQLDAALLQLTAADIAELTDSDDGADEVKANVSHEAMDLAATRTDEKSSGYMDNFRLSVEWEGRVYLGMAKEIYVEEGRKVPTRDREGKDGEAVLLQPKMVNNQYLTINDFSRGRFNVIADVTESSATKRDKTVRKALGLAQIAGPETPMGQAALVTAVSSMDGEGIEGLKKVARRQGLELGVFDPTDEEKAEAAQAQQGAQPSPADQALQAQAAKLMGDAKLSEAKAGTEEANKILKLADAHLKGAQAEAVGGPVAAPEAPSGLDHASGIVDIAHKAADTTLKEAQAEHLRHDMHHQTIKTGHQIEMERREQDLAERQPANDKAAA